PLVRSLIPSFQGDCSTVNWELTVVTGGLLADPGRFPAVRAARCTRRCRPSEGRVGVHRWAGPF
ncbi:MAG: hypothetical protein ACE15D_19305, partial [Candidatus Eisenbacteria bacterium]